MHCTYCTLRPTFQNSINGDQESFRLRARDASVGENEVLNSTDQTFSCSRWILYFTLLLENLCTMMLADAMKTLVRRHQPQLHLLQDRSRVIFQMKNTSVLKRQERGVNPRKFGAFRYGIKIHHLHSCEETACSLSNSVSGMLKLYIKVCAQGDPSNDA